MGAVPNWQPSQILCLEHRNARLYAETIQIVERRQLVWVRPLVLSESSAPDDSRILHDLRQGADLVWPLSLFRAAVDTEVIPLLMQLDGIPKSTPNDDREVRRRLHEFVRQVWLAHPDRFPT